MSVETFDYNDLIMITVIVKRNNRCYHFLIAAIKRAKRDLLGALF